MPRFVAACVCAGGCGYVQGATTGYRRLKPTERKFLTDLGYEVDFNAVGDEIARHLTLNRGTPWNSARFELHRMMCCRPSRFERDVVV